MFNSIKQKLIQKRQAKNKVYSINIIAEFSRESEDVAKLIADMSSYLADIVRFDKSTVITVEVQSQPVGYRLKGNILFSNYNRYGNRYLSALADLSDWIYCNDKDTVKSLYKYQYNITTT